jgi:hypothetical protein
MTDYVKYRFRKGSQLASGLFRVSVQLERHRHLQASRHQGAGRPATGSKFYYQLPARVRGLFCGSGEHRSRTFNKRAAMASDAFFAVTRHQ